MTSPVQVVWFKRDLRVHDHAPLLEASRRGPVVCLYVYEPSLLHSSAESSAAQLGFHQRSLNGLRDSLRRVGGELTLRVGELPGVLDALLAEQPFEHLWAFEETGTFETYERDERVRAWAKARGVPFTELPKDGVIRRLASRDDWAGAWRARMQQPLAPPPECLTSPRLEPGCFKSPRDFGLASTQPLALVGGEEKARELLGSFLETRSRHYRKGMASPVTAFGSSSRLSPYLAWGNLSVRQAYTSRRWRVMKCSSKRKGTGDGKRPGSVKSWRRSLASFLSRLSWHDHFIQKLEDEPELEFRNPNRGFDGLREGEFNESLLRRLESGPDRLPLGRRLYALSQGDGLAALQDARVYRVVRLVPPVAPLARDGTLSGRAVARLRAGHPLAADAHAVGRDGHQHGAHLLAAQTSAEDQDPEGIFIRRWVPELDRAVPDAYLAEPHTAPPLVQGMAGCVIGKDYPAPVVDPKEAYAEAKRRMGEAKASAEVQRLKREVYRRHGSRATPLRRRKGW